MRNPGTAAVLSFLVPGIGQIYNGTILRGVFWLIVTPGRSRGHAASSLWLPDSNGSTYRRPSRTRIARGSCAFTSIWFVTS